MTKKQHYLLCAMLLLSLEGMASMVLDQVIVYINPLRSRFQDIYVSNPNKKGNLYMEADVCRVTNPGEKPENRVKPHTTDEMQLLVAPSKMVVPPGGRRPIRLYVRSAPDKMEQVYRVICTPKSGEIQGDQSGIKIMIGYEVLVFVLPPNARYDLTTRRVNEGVEFINKGNANVLLRSSKLCHYDKTTQCLKESVSQRLYPNQQWVLKLPKDYTASFGLFDGAKEERKTYGIPEIKRG